MEENAATGGRAPMGGPALGPLTDPANTRSDVAAILLAHSHAADRDLFAACRSLTEEQLDRAFAMGPGSIRATLAHNIGAMQVWADAYAGRPRRGWLPDEGPRSLAELERLAEEAHEEWAAIAAAHPLDTVLERQRDGKTQRFTRAHIIAHVTTHSVHHRAQMINMLRQLGLSPLPTGSAMSWVTSSLDLAH